MQCADSFATNLAAVVLQPLDACDSVRLARWRADPALAAQLLRTPSAGGPAEARHWIDACIRDRDQYTMGIRALCDRRSQLVGIARLMFIDHRAGTAELGIYIGDESSRGRGVGRLALGQLLDHGYGTLGLQKIYLRVAADNVVAIKLYQQAGFSVEGRLHDHIRRDSQYVDLLYMAKFGRGSV
ncbi:MAG: GNAT family protein [Pseudomonadota bacterium]